MNIKAIAQIAYETNRAYCLTLGDESQLAWSVAPEWQRTSAINGVQFHLSHLEVGKDPQPSASHESWLKQKQEEGWTFGPVKDPIKKEHPCCVPYDELPVEQRQKDYLFAAVVKAFYQCQLVEA